MGPRPHLWFWAYIPRALHKNKKSIWVPALTCGFVHGKQRLLDYNHKSLWVQDPTCCFCMQNCDFWTRKTSLYWTHTWPFVFSCTTACLASELLVSMAPSTLLWFLHANSDFWTRITNLYGSQTLPVVVCMQYSVIRTRITCLYGSQLLCVVFACKTATFGVELELSICLRPHLSLCAVKTAWLASEKLVSIGPRPHLWILDAKQRLLDRNKKSLWVPDITCRFVLAKQRD